MKTHLFILAMTGMFLYTATACSQEKRLVGNGHVVKKEVPVGTFEEIKLIGAPATVTYRQSDKVECRISGSENILEVLTVKVEGNALVIVSPKDLQIEEKKGCRLTVNLSSPELTHINVTGTGDVLLATPLQSKKDLSLLVIGTGDIKGETGTCRNLHAQVNGTGDIVFSDLQSESATAIVNGTGDIQLPNLQCHSAIATVNGTGDVELSKLKSQSVEATVSGTGDVTLSGQTVSAVYTVTGTGDIDAYKLKAADVSATATGPGNIDCHASRKLHARTDGIGEISYKGNPKEVDFPKHRD